MLCCLVWLLTGVCYVLEYCCFCFCTSVAALFIFVVRRLFGDDSYVFRLVCCLLVL